ncbi:MAG TPA: exodeoxyribonuclease I [Rectinemataceae bacterium]|nr:exodeoxyribonuclease I [Rectinemataceae bacterium]
MAATLFWYDLETFGLDPRYDRIAQFAGLRTDERLERIGEPVAIYCRLSPDYLPSPYSCLVHGITPQHCAEAGVSDYDLARLVRKHLSGPGTVVAGFNSLQFDDEFIRSLLFRNLFDPYEREWKNGNSRWDIIDLMRAAHDLRPEGIVWPTEEGGRPIFTLGALAKANGIGHEAAHDALHDVNATVGLARLVRVKQPKLFRWYYSHRSRDSLRPLVDLVDRTPLVHTAVGYTSVRGCTTLVAPIALDPENRNALVAVDLRFDPASILDLSVEELRRRVFTKAGELDEARLPLSRIRLNRCPALAPLGTLSSEAAERLGLDVEACLAHLKVVQGQPELIQKLVAVYETPPPQVAADDPELRLYDGGFLPDRDASLLAEAQQSLESLPPAEAKQRLYALRFQDDRPAQLIRRLFARNFPDTLGEEEAKRWRGFCAGRLQFPPVPGATDLATYSKVISQRLEDASTPARDRAILHALLDYRTSLEREILRYEPGSP